MPETYLPQWPEEFEYSTDDSSGETSLGINAHIGPKDTYFFTFEMEGPVGYAEVRMPSADALQLALYLIRNLDPKEA